MSSETSGLGPGVGAPLLGAAIPPGGLRRLALQVDHAIGIVAEFVGAVLVVAEIAILFSGVVSRYVFNSP
ncbi:MAG: hypothetical protein JO021_02475, partial [Alphaproteobacteria bacterium]|nr:hypothetical protein [Alphaproteobacteria bacterium]